MSDKLENTPPQKRKPLSSRVHLGVDKALVIVGANKSERKTMACLCKDNIIAENRLPPDFGFLEVLDKIKEMAQRKKTKCIAVIFCSGEKGLLPAAFFRKVKKFPQQLKDEEGRPLDLIVRILVIGPPRKNLSALAIQLGADDYLIKSEPLLVKFLREKLNLLLRLRRKGEIETSRHMIEKGRGLADEGLYEKALKYYLGAHGLKEGDSTLKFLVGSLYEEYGDCLEKEYGAGETREGETAEKIVTCYSEAIKWYMEAIRVNSLFIKPILALSELFRKQGHLIPEAMVLKKLETASLGNPDTYYRMGRNSLEQGNAEEALYFFSTALRRVDEKDLLSKADLHRRIGMAYVACLHRKEAEENFRRALYFMKEDERNRKKSVTLKYKKVGEDKEGYYEEDPLAFKQRREMVKIYEGLMMVMLGPATGEEKNPGGIQEAIKLGKEALQLNPVAENIWNLMGKAHETLGEKEEARECFYHYRFFSSVMDMGEEETDSGLAW